MTLITHLWNKDYHIVAADGRIVGPPVIDGIAKVFMEDCRKTIPYPNGFASFFSEIVHPDEMKEIVTENNPNNAAIQNLNNFCIATQENFRNRGINAKFGLLTGILNSKYNKTILLRNGVDICPLKAYNVSFNGGTNPDYEILRPLFEEAYLMVFKEPFQPPSFSRNLPSDLEVKTFFKFFYNKVIVSKANTKQEINNLISIYLVEKDGSRWIQEEVMVPLV